jgi:hypothetical protein
MGFLKKIFKGIKKVVKKIGRGIKKVAKGLSKAFGKLGILGQLGLMFIPGIGQILAGMLGTLGTGVATFMSTTFGAVGQAAVSGFKAIMGGIKAASGAMGKVFGTVTDAITGGLNWITKTASGGRFKTLGDVFDGFAGWVQDTGKKIFGTPTTSDVISDDPFGIKRGLELGPPKDIGKSGSLFDVQKTYSATDQSILDTVKQYQEKGLSNLADDALRGLSPEGKGMLESPSFEYKTKSLSDISDTYDFGKNVETAAKNANSTWDNIVTKGKEELLSGVTSGIRQKGRELITGKPPIPNYIKNYIPDWMSTLSAFDSDIVGSTDFALQQRGGLYGSNGETIASFGQEFSRNIMQDDPYKTVMASLSTPFEIPKPSWYI